MPATDKQPPTEMQVERQIERVLAERIPAGWSLRARRTESLGPYRVDLLAEVASPAGESAALAVEIKRALEPRDVSRVVEQISVITAGELPRAVPVVAAAYLSPRARAMLRARGVGYVDITGNVRIEISAPGLFISTDGADRDPWPREHKLRSLRGRGAARAMRAIIDTRPPYGVRELAQATGASAPTLSRVLDLLEREASRDPRTRRRLDRRLAGRHSPVGRGLRPDRLQYADHGSRATGSAGPRKQAPRD